MYSKDLKQYCEAVSKNPDELLELKVEGIRNVGTSKEPQAEKLLDSFLYNCPKVTIHIKISILCAETPAYPFFVKNSLRCWFNYSELLR
jgi:hypothetical protein